MREITINHVRIIYPEDITYSNDNNFITCINNGVQVGSISLAVTYGDITLHSGSVGRSTKVYLPRDTGDYDYEIKVSDDTGELATLSESLTMYDGLTLPDRYHHSQEVYYTAEEGGLHFISVPVDGKITNKEGETVSVSRGLNNVNVKPCGDNLHFWQEVGDTLVVGDGYTTDVEGQSVISRYDSDGSMLLKVLGEHVIPKEHTNFLTLKFNELEWNLGLFLATFYDVDDEPHRVALAMRDLEAGEITWVGGHRIECNRISLYDLTADDTTYSIYGLTASPLTEIGGYGITYQLGVIIKESADADEEYIYYEPTATTLQEALDKLQTHGSVLAYRYHEGQITTKTFNIITHKGTAFKQGYFADTTERTTYDIVCRPIPLCKDNIAVGYNNTDGALVFLPAKIVNRTTTAERELHNAEPITNASIINRQASSYIVERGQEIEVMLCDIDKKAYPEDIMLSRYIVVAYGTTSVSGVITNSDLTLNTDDELITFNLIIKLLV